MSDDRIGQAEAFLTEVVYRSRANQAVGASLKGSGNCGLGDGAAVELNLSPTGEQLFAALWPATPDPAQMARIRGIMSAWVERQDALDRKRNHFLRDFRQAHGFDRVAYTAEDTAAYDAGLRAVNDEVNRRRHEAAQALVE